MINIKIWDRFWKLVIVWELQKNDKNRFLKCKCDCWKEINIILYSLTRNKKPTKSCWCLIWKNKFIHWLSSNYLYSTYNNIIDRCNNINNKWYKNYWWRWIKCEWNSFEEFYKDMWDKPSDLYSIDRIDVNWNYNKENCKWANQKEQWRNRRNNTYLTYNWKTMCLSEWCEELWVKKIWR